MTNSTSKKITRIELQTVMLDGDRKFEAIVESLSLIHN